MNSNINPQLLHKYILGTATLAEKEMVLSWIEMSEENGKIYSEIKNSWVAERYKNFSETEKIDNIEKVFFRQKNNSKLVKRYRFALFAASIIVLLTVSTLYFLFFEKEIYIPEQTATQIEYQINPSVRGVIDLPDGSRVWLNSSSSLKCPEKFDSLQRVVELDGEGYFEVISNKEWPMYIKTPKGYGIKVTGTSFNLSSYSDDKKMVVTLIKGAISVINETDKSEIRLKPDEEVTIIKENKPIISKRVDTTKKTAWKTGYLLFDNTPMNEVIKKIERWYGVDCTVKDSVIFDYRFTANFKSESLQQVLEILRLSSKINSKIENNTHITLMN